MKLRESYNYGIAVPTSMATRICPPNGAPVHTSNMFQMQATSGESNAVNVASSLGIKGLVLTNFVKDSPISYFIKSELRKRNIDYFGPDIPPGGPWGYRHPCNVTDSGFGTRAPRVYNDRAGEVGRILNEKDFDFDKIFGELGVGILHLSGIVAALSADTTKFCIDVINAAKRHGTLVSIDLNHRVTFWEGREKELRESFTEMVSKTDILIGNEEDYQLSLGIEGPEHGGKDLSAQIDRFKEMIYRVKKTFPNASVFGNTLRQVISVNEHMWGALSLFGDEFTVIEPKPIRILDRIGGGDGFSGGLLYGILKGMSPKEATEFGWASGALATTVLEDYASPADEEMIWNIVKGNARVRR